jgi:hypothetical protein
MRDNTKYSSYWLKDGLFDDDSTIVNDNQSKQNNLLALASYKRAVSNFVNIVTGENINVTFDQRGGDSYTDGKSVTISAKMDDKDFDPTVGLALHEGSHIKLTDFNTLKDFEIGKYPNPIDPIYIAELMEKYGGTYISDATDHINGILKNLLNVIEDRRIDNYIYTTSPGYKGYYHSMYDKYFNAKIVDKGLQSSEYRTNDWESYMFRIINITNAHRDLDALPMLRKVWEMLDLKNIGRLKNTYEAFTLAAEVFKVIEDSIPSPQKSDNNDDSGNGSEGDSSEDMNGGGDSSETNGSDNTEGSGGESTESSNGMDDSDGDAEGDDVMSGQPNRSSNGGGGKGSSDVPDLTDRQKKQLEKAIEKQKKFQNGDITKKKVSKTENEKLKTLSNAGIEQKEAGSTYGGQHYYRKNTSTPVIVVRNFTKQLVDSKTIDMICSYDWRVDNNQQNINKGIQIGIQLGKRLKVRSEERSLITPRMKNGRISGRLLHELGMGNTQIFDQTVINKHKPAFVHISIDASGSMNGSNWDNAQVAAVAIAKAASMTSNLDVVISYRSIQHSGGNNYQPLTLIAYDSRKDKISKIQQLFKYLDTNGTTPEGLCFESILDDIVKTNKGVDSYFINFSDGQPGFDNNDIYYSGEYAIKHTAEQVRKMNMAGVKVMSYFITDYGYAMDNFKAMYGKGAQRIDVTSLIPLAKTLNKMFE